MRKLVAEANLEEEIEVHSAGTGTYHVGEPADQRARDTAQKRGVILDSVAAQFEPSHFNEFDYVIAMDRANMRALRKIASKDAHLEKVQLLRTFDSEATQPADVADPYYGDGNGFEHVFDVCEAACKGFLKNLVTKHKLSPSLPVTRLKPRT